MAKFINRTYVYIDTVNGWKCLHQNWKLINSSNIWGMVFDIGILGFLILQIFLSFYNVVHSNRPNQVLVHNKTINSQTAIFLHRWSKMISFIRQLFRASSDFFRMNVQHISAWVLRCDRWLQWTQITYWIRSILRLPQKGAGWNRG